MVNCPIVFLATVIGYIDWGCNESGFPPHPEGGGIWAR